MWWKVSIVAIAVIVIVINRLKKTIEKVKAEVKAKMMAEAKHCYI